MDSAITGTRVLTIDLEAAIGRPYPANALTPSDARNESAVSGGRGRLPRRPSCRASTPTFWTVATQADFLKGDVENLSIDSDGRVFLGPATTQVAETSAPFLWTLLAGADGTLWAGSGNEGQVLKIARDGKTSTFFDAPEMEVHAHRAGARRRPLRRHVARRQDLPGRRGRHVEDVLRSRRQVHLGARRRRRRRRSSPPPARRATSTRSRPTARASLFYKTNTTNVVSLAIDKAGNLLAGTESPGRIFRIDRERQGVRPARLVVQGDPRAEARRRRHDLRRGVQRPAGRRGPLGPVNRGDPPTPPLARRCRPSPPKSPASPSSTPRRRVARRIGGAGVAAAQSEGGDLPHPPRRLVGHHVGSGRRLAVRRADRARRVAAGRHRQGRQDVPPRRAIRRARRCSTRAAARQVTALVRDAAGRIVAATSNPGKMFALVVRTRAPSGTYESDVRDAGTVATWGAIRWRAAAAAGRGRDHHALRQHRDARRNLERLVEGLCRRRTASRSRARTRATCSGAPC